LLLRPEESFHLREIARLTGVGLGALQRELAALTAAGVLQRRHSGRQGLLSSRSGYEAAKGAGAHNHTIESLKFTLMADARLIDALQAFRANRGGAVYESVGIASPTEIAELRELALELHRALVGWLKRNRHALH
jgi:hypothetical protein